VPAERALVLTEATGSFPDQGITDLLYVVAFGHSPGHIALLHTPSGTLLAGDAFFFAKPVPRLSRAADANDARVSLNHD
jgi:glyoxylase-like metal-dependent hydrolase (beta-lactamase superfamily II)